MPPRVFPILCVYREAMRLQRFTPTCTYRHDDHYPIYTKLYYGCLLALCGLTMNALFAFCDNLFST